MSGFGSLEQTKDPLGNTTGAPETRWATQIGVLGSPTALAEKNALRSEQLIKCGITFLAIGLSISYAKVTLGYQNHLEPVFEIMPV